VRSNKFLTITLSLGLVLGISQSTYAAAKKFKNCTELNKVYPGGVALPGAVNAGGATKKEPKYDKALYTANKKSDRDKDGIACEK
jgi:Excalibur calcium-binding domain